MLFDKTVINKVAHLAKLDIPSDNDEKFTSIASDLNRIGAMVSLIEKANTQNVAPMAHPFEMAQRLRPDVVTEGNQLSIIMTLAPKHEENLFLVPKVIE